MFNNIIGLKPIRGLISTRSVVPACRTLDCSSIFAETFWDAAIVLSLVRDFDELDPYLRLPSISFVVQATQKFLWHSRMASQNFIFHSN
jgi:allophanate hydrolase